MFSNLPEMSNKCVKMNMDTEILCNFACMFNVKDYIADEVYGGRLLISLQADQSELVDNIRVARVLLGSFPDMSIRINEHLLEFGHKNPEYTINGKLGDRKGVESENGIKSAFRKAKEQGCQIVVLDFDMHLAENALRSKKVVSGIYGRHEDFTSGQINECYVVHNSRAVVVRSDVFSVSDKDEVKRLIEKAVEKLRT